MYVFLMLFYEFLISQGIAISNVVTTPDPSALLDIDAQMINPKKGLLIPRMTKNEKDNIPSPATSLLVYQTDTLPGYYYFDGVQWVLLSSSLCFNENFLIKNSTIHQNCSQIYDDGFRVGIGTTTPSGKLSVASDAGEDVFLFYDNPSIPSTEHGQSLYIYRKAPWAEDYMRFYINKWREGQILTSGSLYFISGGHMYFQANYGGDVNLAYFGGLGSGDVNIFLGSGSGVNRKVKIYGYPSGSAGADFASFQIVNPEHSLEISTNDTNGNILLSPGKYVGIKTASPSSVLHVFSPNGYDQFQIQQSYTPTSTSDPVGNIGNICWDENYIYVKTSSGWKRTALSTW